MQCFILRYLSFEIYYFDTLITNFIIADLVLMFFCLTIVQLPLPNKYRKYFLENFFKQYLF